MGEGQEADQDMTQVQPEGDVQAQVKILDL